MFGLTITLISPFAFILFKGMATSHSEYSNHVLIYIGLNGILTYFAIYSLLKGDSNRNLEFVAYSTVVWALAHQFIFRSESGKTWEFGWSEPIGVLIMLGPRIVVSAVKIN